MDSITEPHSAWNLDVDGDGATTLSDLGPWLLEAFFVPGDWLIWLVASRAPWVAAFLEIGPADYGSFESGFVSALAWLALLVAAGFIWTRVRAFDEALTARIAMCFEDAKRRLRVASRLLGYRARRFGAGRPAAAGDVIELNEELPLSPGEMRILSLHADAGLDQEPDVGQLVEATGERKQIVLRTLRSLEQQRLIERVLDGARRQVAHRLTAAGRALVLYRKLSR